MGDLGECLAGAKQMVGVPLEIVKEHEKGCQVSQNEVMCMHMTEEKCQWET